MAVFDVLRLVVGAAILLYASVSDLRIRRVPNRTWLVGGAIGLAFLLVEVAFLDRIDPLHLVLVPILMGLAYVFWYFHLLAGGADAKALMMLALFVPYPIELEGPLAAFPWWDSPFPPAAVIFANSLLIFILMPFLFVAYNLARGDVRFPAMLLGYTMSVDRVGKSFVWVSERVDADGKVQQLYMSSKQTPEEQDENLERLRAAGRKRVWVTPKIPFMVPLLGGFLAAFVVGDVFTKILTLTILRS